MRSQTIYYISALPGIGKTKWAVDEMTRRILANEGITIYCAPTIKLLKEVEQYLEERVGKTHYNRIISIYSNDEKTGSVKNGIRLSLEGGVDERGLFRTPVVKGGVLLITHAGFISIHEFPRIKEISVIFDEAKKLVTQHRRIDFSSPTSITAFNELLNITTAEGFPFQRVTPKIGGKQLSDICTTVEAKRQFPEVLKILQLTKNPRIEVYVKISKESYSFFEAIAPVKIFEGFKHVVVMASHFEDSQMYYMLQHRRVKLIDITEDSIEDYPEILSRINERYARTSIVPLTFNDSPLSKYLLNSVLIREKFLHVVRKQLFNLNLGLEMKDLKQLMFNNREFKLRENVKDAIQLLKEKEVVVFPIQWMIDKSIDVVNTMIEQKQIPKSLPPLLVVNNINRDKVLNDERFTLLPAMPHGLNKYSKHNVVIFLAAINPSPLLIKFFNYLLPGYEFEKDHVADTCIQCVARSSIRDIHSKKDVLIIVPDKAIAAMLNQKMGNCANYETSYSLPYKMLDVPKQKPLSDKEKASKRRENVNKAVKRYKINNKEKQKLMEKRSKLKRMGKFDEANEITKKIDEINEKTGKVVN